MSVAAVRGWKPFDLAFYGVVAMAVAAVSAGLFAGGRVESSGAKGSAAAPVAVSRVLENSEWLSENAWRKRREVRRTNPWTVERSERRASVRLDQGGVGPADALLLGGSSGNYRTVCVRLCDGYYFPISFSTDESRLDDDETTCRSRCSGDARLFYYDNSEGSPETMKDIKGRAYAALKTAFLYRTNYNPSCRCRSEPWSAEAQQRHAMYATKAWQKKARVAAMAEHRRGLEAVSQARHSSRFAGNRAGRGWTSAGAAGQHNIAIQPRPVQRSESGRMSLGASAPSQPRAVRKKAWRQKVLFGVGGEN